MRVLCVKPFKAPESKDKPRPEVGDEDVVFDQMEIWGIIYYNLQRFGDEFNYCADHFATLPDEPAELIEESIVEPEMVTA